MQIVVILTDGAAVEAILPASCTTCLRGWKHGHGNYRCIVMVCKLITRQSVPMDKYPVREACLARFRPQYETGPGSYRFTSVTDWVIRRRKSSRAAERGYWSR
jgi:hypothetical protein